jgi:hypothetical protein
MKKLREKKLREYDGRGLRSAGVEWREPCQWREAAFLAAFVIGTWLMLLGFEMLKKSHWLSGGSLLACAACLAFLAFEYRREYERPRSLIFEGRGLMLAPLGMPSRYWLNLHFEIEGHHDEIVSIEPIVDDSDDGKSKDHKVAIYFRSGSIVRVTNPVHKDRAHRIAVQLTAALHELRATRGRLAA